MGVAEITALATGIPAILAAITGLITALKAKGTANTTQNALTDHIASVKPSGGNSEAQLCNSGRLHA